jgi:hypothetical protein
MKAKKRTTKTKRTATRAKKDLTPRKDVAGGMFSAEGVSRAIQMKDEMIKGIVSNLRV